MNKLKSIMLGLGIMSITLTSCGNDDDGPSYSARTMENAELKNILMQKGYSFNEQGALLLDDLAKNTTSLDLSGTGISDFSGLEIFPNLTDLDLSDNGYEKSFDFSRLPAQITGVDLTGNELYEFPGLLDIATRENGDEDVTVLHALNKLYLPHSAKYNCDEIPTFFAQDVCPDMQMTDANGTLEAYNTLREVPDENMLKFLKESFPSIFQGNKIDLSKRFVNPSEATKGLVITMYTQNKNVEGVQYVIMNPSYRGAQITLESVDKCTLPYLKVDEDIYNLYIDNIDTKYLNTSSSVNLCSFNCSRNNTITDIDLSASQKMGQRGPSSDFATGDAPSELFVYNCDELKSIEIPSKAKYLNSIVLYNLPKLKKWDMSGLSGVVTMDLGNLTGLESLTYFTPDGFYGYGMNIMLFTISEDIYKFSSTKDFLDKYHTHLMCGMFSSSTGVTTYFWNKNY